MLFASCSKDDEEVLPKRTITDVRNDFANLQIHTRVNDISIESTKEGYFWEMRIIVPESASSTNNVPLINTIVCYSWHRNQLFNYDISSTLIQAFIDAGSDITFISATDLEHYNSLMHNLGLIFQKKCIILRFKLKIFR